MTKLIDKLGTKYLASHYASDVAKILAEEDEVDVADTRICYDVMTQLLSRCYSGSVKVVDSKDTTRNAFFAENRKRGELNTYYSSIQKPIYLPESVEMIMRRIGELDPNVVYEIKDAGIDVWAGYTFLIQALRPEIQLRISTGLDQFLTRIYDQLDFTAYKWEEFYVLKGLTFEVMTPDPENYDMFVRSNIVVPTVLGKEPLQDKDAWQGCLEHMSKLLVLYLDPPCRKMRDFLDL